MGKQMTGIIITAMVLTTGGISIAGESPPPKERHADASVRAEGKKEAMPPSAADRENPFHLLPITPRQSDMEDCFNDPLPLEPKPTKQGEI